MEDVSFGDTLCLLRKRNRLTQRELAKKLNVHITTIKNWEGDNCCPDARNICTIADLFHVTTDYLLGRDCEATYSLEGLTSAERKQLLHIIQAYYRYIAQAGRQSKKQMSHGC